MLTDHTLPAAADDMAVVARPSVPVSHRAVGVVRVSRVGDREAEHFVSPSEQRGRIAQACRANGLELVALHEELDVSGGLPIDRRAGLREALAAIEAGRARTVIVAYFDRLVRSLRVQGEIVERVEKAGGSILAVDVGQVRADTASHWLSSTMLGAVAEYSRRMTAERTAEAKIRAVMRGVPPFRSVVPGYRFDQSHRIVVDAQAAPIVREAFAMREQGASWREIRDYLADNGIPRTLQAVGELLRSRMVLGELRFGELVNLDSHPAIVDRALWERVQRRGATPAQPGPKSDQLLSGLRLLRCANCGATLVVARMKKAGRSYPVYRCNGHVRPCQGRVSIAATLVEQFVSDYVRRLLADQSATATAGATLDEARDTLEQAQAALNRAIRRLAVVEDEDEAQALLVELRSARDAALDRVAELERVASVSVTVNASADWSVLTLGEKRSLIGAVLRSVVVASGKGTDRIRVELAAE